MHDSDIYPMHEISTAVSVASGKSTADEATKEQVGTLLAGANKHVDLADKNHFAGRYKAAHSNLVTAASHVGSAARVLDGAASVNYNTDIHPAERAKYVASEYKSNFGE